MSQWSGADDKSHKTEYETDHVVQTAQDITKIRIKSPWATDQGNPLKFNIKWEYLTDDDVKVVSNWVIIGDGTSTGNTTSVSTKDTTTPVDGKCEAQWHNAGQKYEDHQNIAQEQSGRDIRNDIDKKFRENDPLIGWFSVTFDRATGE